MIHLALTTTTLTMQADDEPAKKKLKRPANVVQAAWEIVDGPILERDDNLRAMYGVNPEATILNYLIVKHHAMPIEDKTTIISIEGPPRKPRQSQAGRKPRRRPGIRHMYRPKNEQLCSHCQAVNSIDEDPVRAELVCRECSVVVGKSDGQLDFDDQTHMETLYNNNSNNGTGQCYDNANHFRDILLQIQGLEPMKLPKPELMDEMREYMRTHCIKQTTLTPSGTYKILQAMGLTTLYKHKVKLTYMLSGIPPKTLDVGQVEKLCLEFQKIQGPMLRAMERRKRKNFPSCNYILFKFCEMFQWHDICNVCYLLKTNSKLDKLDEIWKEVCEDLKDEDYEFIPSPTFNTHHK
jgi:hypothetical protein